MAEKEGFEPPEPCDSAVFKTAAIDHSATSPFLAKGRLRSTLLLIEMISLVNWRGLSHLARLPAKPPAKRHVDLCQPRHD